MKKLVLAGLVAALSATTAASALEAPSDAPASSFSATRQAPRYVVVERTALTPELRKEVRVVSERTDADGRRVAVLDLGHRSIPSLSDLLPDRTKGTGGFRSFSSETEALTFVATPKKAQKRRGLAAGQIDEQDVVKPMLEKVKHENVFDTIKHLSTNWPNRYTETQNAKEAADWLKGQYEQYAGDRDDVITEFYDGCTNCGGAPVVVHTIKGSENPDEYVVLGGHYDSIVSASVIDEDTPAPGADDNASSQGTLMETVRVLHESGFKPKRTLVFMSFPAEETGLNGSAAAADWFASEGRNVVGVLNFDMTNYRAEDESNDFSFISDHTSSEQNAFAKSLIEEYMPDMKVVENECGYECSDHAPWTAAGFPASTFAEPTLFDNLHTPDDTLEAMGDTAEPSAKFVKLALAFAVEQAESAA